jgi:histidyl-tRNA synthetase
MPGIGFAVGMERLVLLMKQVGGEEEPVRCDLFIVALGKEARDQAFVLNQLCRNSDLKTGMDPAGRSLKNQMKQAGKSQARFTFILGEDELANHAAILRNMATKEQQEIPLAGDPADWCRKIRENIES